MRSTGSSRLWTGSTCGSPTAASCSAPQPVETDWRLFTTLVRFDAVYQIHFKCSIRKLVEYEQPLALRP